MKRRRLVITEDAARTEASFERRLWVGERGVEMQQVELRLWDKVAALEKLGRHLGMFDKGPEGDHGGLTIRVVHE